MARSGVRDAGFTVIEILAVMVVVGLLTAISVPQFSKWREHEHVAELRNDARLISGLVEAHWTEHRQYPEAGEITIEGFEAVVGPGNTVPVSEGTTLVEWVVESGEYRFTLGKPTRTSRTVTFDSALGGFVS